MTVSPELDNAREPARELFQQGFSLVAIARTLNVSVVSLLRWRQQDAGMGRTWSSTGISQAGHPGLYDLQTPEDRQSAVILAQLRTHLAGLARQAMWARGKGAAQRPPVEDRMLKVCRVIEHPRAPNRTPREPRCASGRVAARRGDGDVLGSGTARSLDAADDGPRRNPQGRASFVACLCRSGLAHWSPMRVALASWPATRSAPSRPRGVLLGAPSPATDDIMPQLVAMQRFADFCVRNLCEAEMPPVRKAVRLFLDDLKARHS